MNTCQEENVQTATSNKVYQIAAQCLGISLIPPGDDRELGCAISVTALLREKCEIQIPETTSTYNLLASLLALPALFKEVAVPLPGDIIIAATGTQPSTSPLSNGHTGVVAKYGILSNNSYTGLWSEVYTLRSWHNHYDIIGQFRTRYFRPL